MHKFLSALLLLAPAATTQDLNRLDLNNGGDVLLFLNSPYVGAPVSNFDITGDLYWKAFPRDALRRCDGEAGLMGLELAWFENDSISSQVLWAYTVTTGTTGTDQTILPGLSEGVFVPGLSTTGSIFGPGTCTTGGYLTGWIYVETFVDTATGMPAPLLDLTADGSEDWVFTHYFPAPGIADQDPQGGPPNACGGVGDWTAQWLSSNDLFGTAGENQPDWTGLGNSGYGGFNVGGSGTFSPVPDEIDDASQVAWFFDEPTIAARVDTDNGDGFPGPEVGTAGLNTPLQINSSGIPSPGTTTIGAIFYDASADSTGLSISLWGLNVGPTLLDLGIGCIDLAGGTAGVNLADPAFALALPALGLNPFATDANGDTVSFSNQVPAGTGPSWVDLQLSWQGFTVSLVTTSVTGSSQVLKQTLRYNDGL